MSKVCHLPADQCKFHLCGRCLYEEILNPGYEQSWRCDVLVRWEGLFDEFISRAEAFGLSEGEVSGLWAKRFERLVLEECGCGEFVFDPMTPPPSCLSFHDGLCLLRFPHCESRCRRYELGKPKCPCGKDEC